VYQTKIKIGKGGDFGCHWYPGWGIVFGNGGTRFRPVCNKGILKEQAFETAGKDGVKIFQIITKQTKDIILL